MGKEVEAQGEGECHTAGGSLAQCLHTTSLVILALLLPLAFLLLARLTANPLLLLSLSSFLRADLLLLLSLLSGVCVATLLNAVLGRGEEEDGAGDAAGGHTGLAWAFLCLFQLCVGLGVEAAIAAGVGPACAHALGVPGASWARRAAFFLGMHEATLFWVRNFVRPVVDDAIFRAPSPEWRGEGVAVGAGFGLLWLWTLAGEVDGLLAVAVGFEGGPPPLAAAGRRWYGFVLWMVTNVTVMVGAVRAVTGFIWVGRLLLLRAWRRGDGEQVEFSDSYDSSYKLACEV